MSAAQSLEEMAERADAIVAEHRRVPDLDVVRALLNETGIRRARSVLVDAPDVLGNALESLRSAQEAERRAREDHDAAVSEASWLLDEHFYVEGNKQFLRIDTGQVIEGMPVQKSRPMLAAEKAAYIATEAAKQPAVAKAAEVLHAAAENTAACRDAVEVARAMLAAAKTNTNAAIAELEALVAAIPTSKENAR